MTSEDLVHSTVQCIHFTSAVDAPNLKDLSNLRFVVAQIDGALIGSDQELFSAISGALNFPEWFGANWDALNDCLRDLEWLPGEGCVLLVQNASALWRNATSVAGGLVESWLYSADFWIQENLPFHLVFLMETIVDEDRVVGNEQ